jgi:hypothetical protein
MSIYLEKGGGGRGRRRRGGTSGGVEDREREAVRNNPRVIPFVDVYNKTPRISSCVIFNS